VGKGVGDVGAICGFFMPSAETWYTNSSCILSNPPYRLFLPRLKPTGSIDKRPKEASKSQKSEVSDFIHSLSLSLGLIEMKSEAS
jgi:hypothetical protein